VKKLVAALETLRANLALVVAEIEDEKEESALATLDRSVQKFDAQMKALRS
jgi:hypothetical protein